ncbi:MAG: hypothetical protein ABSB18_06210 [Candidatus Omnitrophota bacterium]
MAKKKKIKRKLPWIDMEITRVQLSPEQTVLGDCNAVGYPSVESITG